MSTVAIMEASYANCHLAVERLFKMFPLDLEGKKVVIKPNVLRSAAPEEGITTHPSVLRAVINEVVSRRPASLVVGDNPGVFSYGMNEKAFKDTGLMEAAGSYYRNLSADTVIYEISSPYIEHAQVSRAIMEADIYISVPKFKTHGLTGLSCAIKNNFGLLAGGLKAQTHKKAGTPLNFAEALVDVFAIRIPDLVIVDGVLAMEGNGPASKDLVNLGRMLGGYDSVAVDAVVAYMMGFSELPHTIKLAGDKGYGISDLSRISIDGKLEVIQGFKLPQGVKYSSLDEVTELKPRVDIELCSLCENCVMHCPNGALKMEEYPVLTPELCITCFCCQELCPQKAIELK